jgi:hypothetical protein
VTETNRDTLVHVLWWTYSDGSNQDVVRVYKDLEKAQADISLFGEHSHVQWRLTSLPLT